MYIETQERKAEEYKFLASIHGVTLDGDESAPVADKNTAFTPFGDPETYKKMSEADRKDLTDSMLSKHKQWAENTTFA